MRQLTGRDTFEFNHDGVLIGTKNHVIVIHNDNNNVV